MSGANTAPLYLRISGSQAAIESSDLASQFLAYSTATGNTATPEPVAAAASGSNQKILRWRWVLISNPRFYPTPASPITRELDLTVEYAYDRSCDNESDALPDSLVWRRLPLADHSSATDSFELKIPALRHTLVPHRSIRDAINWGGDLRAIYQSFPANRLPWIFYLLISLLLTGAFLLSAFRGHADAEPDLSGRVGRENRPLRAYWPSLMIFAIFAVLVFSAMPVYDVNDDQRMIAMLAGHWQLPAGPRALFISVILGWPLQLLYSIAPTIPWYGLMLEGGLLGAFFVIASAGTRFFSPLVHGIAFALLLVFVGFLPAVRPTFSVVAAISGTAGIIGMLSLVFDTSPGKRHYPGILLLSVLLLLFSSFLRFGAFAITVVVLSPTLLLLWRQLQQREFRTRSLGVVGGFGVATILALTGQVVEKAAYSSDTAWNGWKEKNRIRAKALDWNTPGNYTDESSPVVLSSPELAMLSRHMYLDSQLVDPVIVASLAQAASVAVQRNHASPAQLFDDANRSVRQLLRIDPAYGNPLLLAGFIGASALLILRFEQDSRLRVIPLFALLWSITLLVALALLTKPVPYRVSYGMLFPAGLIATLGLARLVDQARRSGRSTTGFLMVLLILLAAPAVSYHGAKVAPRRERFVNIQEEIQGIAESGERDIILHYLPSYAFPVLTPHPEFAPVCMHDTTYVATTPVAARARSESGFTDLPDLLKRRDHVLFLAANPDHTIYGVGASQSDLESYLRQRLGDKVSVSVVQENYHWTWLKLSAF